MIAHKHITKLIAGVMAAAVLLCLCAVIVSDRIAAAVVGTKGARLSREAFRQAMDGR